MFSGIDLSRHTQESFLNHLIQKKVEIIQESTAKEQKLYLLQNGDVYGIGKGFIGPVNLSQEYVLPLLNSVKSLESTTTGWIVIKNGGEIFSFSNTE
jgi:hypothetical protein